MVFASLTFLYIFLPLNLILYYISKNALYRNIVLTLFSLVFYAWGEPVWIVLLLLTALVDYLNGLFVEKHRGTKLAKIGIISSVAFNVGTLLVFKYSQFIITNINHAIAQVTFDPNMLHIFQKMHLIFPYVGHGSNLALPVPAFTLPVGLSFYTFQSISYVIDVYRGEVRAQRSFLDFLMFVSLYHQLVAGPIVRYAHIQREIESRKFNIVDVSAGVTRFCVGLFKKVFIADVAADFVDKKFMIIDPKYGSFMHDTVTASWIGILLFTIQIYYDFSGYSDMAIGLGRMFGFHYYENFRYPYIAKSATEFWRRWHISLSSWFRDYIYIPLGGNRKNAILNLFIVWFLTGMWHGGAHGACWNFIIWGLFFGVLIFLERLFLANVLRKIPGVFGHIYLLFAVVVSWAIFYFTDLGNLWNYFKIMFGATANAGWDFKDGIFLRENMFWLFFAIVMCMPVYTLVHRRVKRHIALQKSNWLWGMNLGFTYLLLIIATTLLVGNSYHPFIYYRF